MIDIISAENGQDLVVYKTQTPKAANILSIQLGSLEYAQDFGIDLKYFLSDDIKFQDLSFKAYLVERLAQSGINVTSVLETFERLYKTFNFNISPEDNSGGMVAR